LVVWAARQVESLSNKRERREIDEIPQSPKGRVVQTQLAKAASSAAANYRAAQRSRSRADFISKLSIALEEIDETAFLARVSARYSIELRRVRNPSFARSGRVIGHLYDFTQNCSSKREKGSLDPELVHALGDPGVDGADRLGDDGPCFTRLMRST